jgi:AraC-like DNA-binding protein
MQFYTIDPDPLLGQYVRYFWVLEGDKDGQGFINGRYTHRTMACGCPELFFHYKGTFDEILEGEIIASTARVGIQGQTSHFRRFTTTESFGLFGVFLYPFAIPIILGIPAEEVNDNMPDLATVLGPPGEMIAEQMMLAKNNKVRATLLTSFLTDRLLKKPNRIPTGQRIIPAIRQVIDTKGQLSISAISDQYFLSRRTFERAFKHYAGFSPKLFSRLLRFENVLESYDQKDKTLTEIAYDCGYYDQSHFIHEFKSFSGHHPRHYFFENAEGTEWKERIIPQ